MANSITRVSLSLEALISEQNAINWNKNEVGSDSRELDFLSELVDLLQVGHFVVGVDEADGDVSGDAAVAVDVRRRAVGRHRDARRLAEVGAPVIVVEHQALQRWKVKI